MTPETLKARFNKLHRGNRTVFTAAQAATIWRISVTQAHLTIKEMLVRRWVVLAKVTHKHVYRIISKIEQVTREHEEYRRVVREKFGDVIENQIHVEARKGIPDDHNVQS